MKKDWKGKKDYIILALVGITAFILVLIFLCPEKDKIIQAELIVILICITWYYAIQTQKLVQEGKKKRDAEFWARAIEEFYIVFLDNLKEYLTVSWPPRNLEQKISIRTEISRLISVKGYMISKETKKRILELSKDFLWVESGVSQELREKAGKSLKAAVKIIDDEKKSLEDKLRKFYEVGEKNDENIKKRKKS